jgi:hypothetical protein
MPNTRISQIKSAKTLVAIASICIFLLPGCNPDGESDLTPESPLEPTQAGPNQALYWNAWEAGPHANTYDLEKGPNTYCAKCHSPTNWDPAAVVDPPPNCVSCKFPFESEPRIPHPIASRVSSPSSQSRASPRETPSSQRVIGTTLAVKCAMTLATGLQVRRYPG